MSLLQAIFVGFIQGLTEFLPVSSSGHLAIFTYIFKMNTDTELVFEVMLHMGTLVAVCIYYRKDVKKLLQALGALIRDVLVNALVFFMNKFAHKELRYRRLVNNAAKKFMVLILVTTVPTGLIGIVFGGLINRASQSLLIPGICLIGTSILLLLAERSSGGKKRIKAMSYKDAGMIGLAQGLATLPGLSRSGATITAGLLLGMNRKFTVKYSFLAAVPAILGANLLQLKNIRKIVESGGSISIIYCIIGAIVAGIVGYICIDIMLRIIKYKKFTYFAYYCAIVGVIAMCCNFVIK